MPKEISIWINRIKLKYINRRFTGDPDYLYTVESSAMRGAIQGKEFKNREEASAFMDEIVKLSAGSGIKATVLEDQEGKGTVLK